MSIKTPTHCHLEKLAFIEVQGKDAQGFLHAQLGLDVMQLGHDRAPLAGWHDSKGRLRALFRILRLSGSWLLMLPANMRAGVLQGLSRYVLRADVSLSAAESFEAVALLGASADWSPRQSCGLADSRDATVYQNELHWISLGPELVHLVTASGAARGLLAELDAVPSEAAERAEIALGLPSIEPGTADRYLPQMLNLDKLGAMSFDKGCYPGQEVIARVHHLGSVKRRMRRFAATVAVTAEPGTPVMSGEQTAIGEVVRSAQGHAGSELLAVVPLELGDEALFVDGSRIEARSLPY